MVIGARKPSVVRSAAVRKRIAGKVPGVVLPGAGLAQEECWPEVTGPINEQWYNYWCRDTGMPNPADKVSKMMTKMAASRTRR